MKELIQKIKCFFGQHMWQKFLTKPRKVCIHCRKSEYSPLTKDYHFGVSFTGFNAMRKD